MKRFLPLLLAFSCGCATIHRHPVLSGIVVGGAAAATVAIVRHHSCANSYNGVPYQGTPPCPAWCAPGGQCWWK